MKLVKELVTTVELPKGIKTEQLVVPAANNLKPPSRDHCSFVLDFKGLNLSSLALQTIRKELDDEIWFGTDCCVTVKLIEGEKMILSGVNEVITWYNFSNLTVYEKLVSFFTGWQRSSIHYFSIDYVEREDRGILSLYKNYYMVKNNDLTLK